jgi:hypothetical protein
MTFTSKKNKLTPLGNNLYTRSCFIFCFKGTLTRIGSGFSDFVDPDLYWESGSRIRIQGLEN